MISGHDQKYADAPLWQHPMVGHVTSDHLMDKHEDEQSCDKQSAGAWPWQCPVDSRVTSDQLTHHCGNVLWAVAQQAIS